MNLYHLQYRERGSWGYYEEYDYIIRSKDVAAAIEEGVHLHPDLRKDCWFAVQLDGDGPHFISHASS